MPGRLFRGASTYELRMYGVILVAVIGAAALVNSTTRKATEPPPDPMKAGLEVERISGRPNPSIHPEAASAFAERLIERSKGDFANLSPDDQRWLNGVTSGHGASYVRERTDQIRAQRKAAAG